MILYKDEAYFKFYEAFSTFYADSQAINFRAVIINRWSGVKNTALCSRTLGFNSLEDE